MIAEQPSVRSTAEARPAAPRTSNPRAQGNYGAQETYGAGVCRGPRPIAVTAAEADSAVVPDTFPEPSKHAATALEEPTAPDLSGDDTQPSLGSRNGSGVVPDLSGFHELRIWAESFEDAQRARISCENRMLRGGVPPELFIAQIEAMRAAEHQIKLAMVRCYRRVVPAGIREWQCATFGIGEHLLARLLGALGHPRIATPYHWEGEGENRKLIPDMPFERTVRQLWSYCGHGDAERKKRKGMSAEEAFTLGSPRTKMLVHLLAEASMKCRVEPTRTSEAVHGTADPTPSADQPIGVPQAKAMAAGRQFRAIYEQRRALAASAHPEWTAGHSHNDALRIVGKEILRALWAATG